MDDLLRPVVADNAGYSAEHEPADIIMDANESPYDLPADVKDEALRRLRDVPYNRYPDSECRELRRKYADYVGVEPDWIVAGNGSDELITYLVTAMIEPGDRVLVPSPTFSMYNLLAEYLHARVDEVPLNDSWELTDEFIRESRDAKITFLSYPNNPTGNCFSEDRIDRVIEGAGGAVVIDEAYFEFSERSYVDRLDEETPLIVLRTLSKGFGLAGLRTGFLLAPPRIVDGVNTVRLPYNLNELSVVTARVALDHREEILARNDELLDQRDRVFHFLDEEGFKPFPTDSNFILFRPGEPADCHRYLLDNGIRIRSFSEQRLQHCLRLSIGTPDENDRFLSVLDGYSP